MVGSAQPPASQGEAGNIDERNEVFNAFHDQLRAIQNRLEKTAVVGESLSSTQHEIQLQLEALSAKSSEIYVSENDTKATELKERIRTLSRQADELTKDLTSSRTDTENSPADVVSSTIISKMVSY